MKNRIILLSMVATSFALAAGAVACSGSDSTDPKKSDTAPNTPSTSGGTSGTPSSSGAMTSGGTSGMTSGGTSGMTSGGTSGMTSGSMPDAGDVDAGNCVPMGYAGNDKKVGAYCDKDVSCPFQTDPFLICTYGHDPTNTHLFCTAPCSKDSECGMGAYCVHDTAGSGCVPTQCGGMPGM